MTLQEWMSTHGYGDAKVAQIIGINRATVSKLRRSKHLPSARLMETFSQITEGSVRPNDWFLSNGQDAIT